MINSIYPTLCLAIFLVFFSRSSICDDISRIESKNNDCEVNTGQVTQPEGDYCLGMMYFDGVSVNQDYKKAFELIEKAANEKNSEAQINVARMYENGWGVQQNNIKAYMYLYILSANLNNLDGDKKIRNYKSHLAEKMTNSEIKQATVLAVEWLIDTETRMGLGNDAFGYKVRAEMFRKEGREFYALLAYRAAAKRGETVAQQQLIIAAQHGSSLYAFNKKRNLEWYKKSAEEGNKKTTLILAYMYLHGKEVKQNKRQALHWYKQAAQIKAGEQANGFNTIAMYLVAWMYDTGQGIPQDNNEAFNWYQQAANAGYGDAQLRLAEMYQQGQGVEQNKEKAIEWIKTAAEQGYHKAQRTLADLYRTGTLLKQNKQLAFQWYQKAAVLEDIEAQYALAQLYASGEGTHKNISKAYVFALYLAQHYDDSDAKKLCQQLEKQLSKTELNQAKEWSEQWKVDAKYRTLGVAVEPPFEW